MQKIKFEKCVYKNNPFNVNIVNNCNTQQKKNVKEILQLSEVKKERSMYLPFNWNRERM